VARHEHARVPDFLGEGERVHGPGAAEGDQREVARVVPHWIEISRIAEVIPRDRDVMTPSASASDAHRPTEARAQPGEGAAARRSRRWRCCRPDASRSDTAEHDVGVGHRRLGAAEPVGHGAGAAPALARADLEASVDARAMRSSPAAPGLPVKIPQLDITRSARALDRHSRRLSESLQPGSARGRAPGPRGCGLGGTEPTVTDANVVLGRIGTGEASGGSIAIDATGGAPRPRRAGLRSARDEPVEALAEGVITISDRADDLGDPRNLDPYNDPRDFTLIAFGAPGPCTARPRPGNRNPRCARAAPPGKLLGARLLASQIKHDDVRPRGPAARASGVARELSARWEGRGTHQLGLEASP